MKTNKTKLLFAGLLTSAMVITATGCSSESSNEQSYDDDDVNSNTPPAPPQVEGCTEWEWDEDEWVCEEGDVVNENGGRFVYFYNGALHKTSYKKTSGYKSKSSVKSGVKSGSNTKVTNGVKSSGAKVSGKSGGMGSGSKGGFSTGG